MQGTRITERLDAEGVPYRRLPFTRPALTVEALAREQGVALDEMVKAILLREQSGPRRCAMACVLGADRVDPQAVRASLPAGEGWRRLTFASAEEIAEVTGCAPGTVAPLCLPPGVPVVFDEAIAARETVNMASGDVGFGLELARADLVRLAAPRYAPIAKAGA